MEEQQSGEQRASYGKRVIQTLSDALNAEFGKGFSVDTLENARKFYLNYQGRMSETLFRISGDDVPFTLSWSHYLQLMRIKNLDERRFYEIEATKSTWSLRTLQRQYNSSLYERLAISRNILGHDTAGTNYTAVANRYTRQNDYTAANPAAITDFYWQSVGTAEVFTAFRLPVRC